MAQVLRAPSKFSQTLLNAVMEGVPYLSFPPFRLNLRAAQLERGEAVLALRPKAYALLHHLVVHRGELLTKDALLDSLWPGRIVTEGGLSELVRELRRLLGDDAREPRYIETVHGRGYRFIARMTEAPSASALAEQAAMATPAPVGRGVQLNRLAEWFARAASGVRQLVFVTGEPGIGKTTVVETFQQVLLDGPHSLTPRIGRGQCIEQYGSAEAYLPVLDALSRLARQDGDQGLINVLRQHAPTWLVQMPALLDSTELEILERRTVGATRERMLREMAASLELLSAERPLLSWCSKTCTGAIIRRWI